MIVLSFRDAGNYLERPHLDGRLPTDQEDALPPGTDCGPAASLERRWRRWPVSDAGGQLVAVTGAPS